MLVVDLFYDLLMAVWDIFSFSFGSAVLWVTVNRGSTCEMSVQLRSHNMFKDFSYKGKIGDVPKIIDIVKISGTFLGQRLHHSTAQGIIYYINLLTCTRTPAH